MFTIPVAIWGPVVPQIAKQLLFSLKYYPSCGKLVASFAKCTSTARHIRHFFIQNVHKYSLFCRQTILANVNH